MSLSLSHFPPEILANVFRHLPPLYLYAVTHLSGDRLIRAKSRRSVTSTRMSDVSLKRLGLKSLHDFESLTHLSIESKASTLAMDLSNLPRTLTSLQMSLPTSPWWYQTPHPDDLNNLKLQLPANAYQHTSFNFKRHFKYLKHLDLSDSMHLWNPPTTRNNFIVLVEYFLPDTLESLSLSLIAAVPAKHWVNLPHGLLIESMYGAIRKDFLEQLIRFVPHLRFKHIDFVGTIDDIPLLSQLNIETVGWWSTQRFTDDLARVCKFFPTGDIRTQRGLEHRDPPQRVSLLPFLTVLALCGTVPEGYSESIEWPASLTELSPLQGPVSFGTMVLPPNLTKLESKVSKSSPIFPPNLKTLTASIDPLVHPPDVWPSQLTSLALNTASWRRSILTDLPKSLKTLNIRCDNAQLCDDIAQCCPRSLTELEVSTSFDERMLAQLPPKLTRFVPKTLILVNASPLLRFMETSPHVCDVQGSASIRRLMDGTWALDPFSRPSNDWNEPFVRPHTTIALQLVAFPKHLTRLKLESIESASNSFDSIPSLPSLTRLKLRTFANWNWNVATPSLTRITVKDATHPVSQFRGATYPPSVTYLKLQSSGSQAAFPTPFAPNLRILRCSSPILATLLRQCRALETLETEFPLERPPEAEIVSLPTVTRFTASRFSSYPVWPTLASLFAIMPELEHLAVRDRYWSVATNDLKPFIPRLKSLECHRITISPDDNRIMDIALSESEDKFDLTLAMAAQIKKDWPNCLFPDNVTIDFPTVTSTQLESLGAVWSKCGLKTLIARDRITLWKRFGKFLPSTLKTLDLLHAAPLDFAAPRYLPSSLTDMKIDVLQFRLDSYQCLPRGLVSLTIMCVQKFFPKHARALPPALEYLDIRFTVAPYVDRHALSHLPDSLTELCVYPLHDDLLITQGLPSQLKTLNVEASYRLRDTVNFGLFPPSMTIYTETRNGNWTSTWHLIDGRPIGAPSCASK